jgi:Uncharacterized protein conserved in bacteria
MHRKERRSVHFWNVHSVLPELFDTMRKHANKTDVIILAVVLIVAGIGILISLLLRDTNKSGLYAKIYHRGSVAETVYLDEDKTFSIESLPKVVFEIKDEAIAFASSDCPDQLCVHMGWQNIKGGFAACLPNDAMIWVESDEEGGVDIVTK